MAETAFEVAYDGPAFAEGRMEVRELAPALLALAELFREANVMLHPDEPPVSLHVSATTRGSFEIYLILAVTAAPSAVSFFTSDPVTAIVNLKELVLGESGLFAFVKRLRGRRVVQKESQNDGTILLVTEDGDRLTFPRQTDTAFQRASIRRRTQEVLEPLDREGVDVVRFRQTDTEYMLELGKEEAAPSQMVELGPVPVRSEDTSMMLEIMSPHFLEGRKWRLSDGSRVIQARIDDESFMARVDRGEEAFRKGDVLVCSIHIDQFQSDTGLRTEYSVTRVHDHISMPAPADPTPFAFDPGAVRDESPEEPPVDLGEVREESDEEPPRGLPPGS